jgi:hypothetical protein
LALDWEVNGTSLSGAFDEQTDARSGRCGYASSTNTKTASEATAGCQFSWTVIDESDGPQESTLTELAPFTADNFVTDNEDFLTHFSGPKDPETGHNGRSGHPSGIFLLAGRETRKETQPVRSSARSAPHGQAKPPLSPSALAHAAGGE